jgi:hypothetical protein
MALLAAGIGVIVQLVNFRLLELDSVLQRARRRSDRSAESTAEVAGVRTVEPRAKGSDE